MSVNGTPPLWLPEGSVRSILALALTGAVVALTWAGKLPPEIIGTAFSMAVGVYFGDRKGAASHGQR